MIRRTPRYSIRSLRFGPRGAVMTAVGLAALGLMLPAVFSGSLPGHESGAGAVDLGPGYLAAREPSDAPSGSDEAFGLIPVTATSAAAPSSTRAAATWPSVIEVLTERGPTTTTGFLLPAGAIITTAQAQDLIKAKFPRSEWGNAFAIVECESRFKGLAVNVNTDGSRDLGLFQINDGGTLQELGGDEAKAFDPVWNVDAAFRLWRAYGWIRWTCAFRVGILDPDLTSTTGDSTTTVTSGPTRTQTSTTGLWPVGATTTAPRTTTSRPAPAAATTTGPAPTMATIPPSTAPPTAAPTSAAPTTVTPGAAPAGAAPAAPTVVPQSAPAAAPPSAPTTTRTPGPLAS